MGRHHRGVQVTADELFGPEEAEHEEHPIDKLFDAVTVFDLDAVLDMLFKQKAT